MPSGVVVVVVGAATFGGRRKGWGDWDGIEVGEDEGGRQSSQHEAPPTSAWHPVHKRGRESWLCLQIWRSKGSD